VAAALAAEGERVLVTGGPDEVALAHRVADAAGLDPDAVVAGRTDVTALASLVAGARRVLCGDTGVAHLATATGTPSVVLFGPVGPQLWGPPAGAHHVALWAGRSGDPHASEPDSGLLAITVEQVLAAIGEFPDASGPRPARPPSSP
jgi:ADP-heptose:LPS heptosyltransferase